MFDIAAGGGGPKNYVQRAKPVAITYLFISGSYIKFVKQMNKTEQGEGYSPAFSLLVYESEYNIKYIEKSNVQLVKCIIRKSEIF